MELHFIHQDSWSAPVLPLEEKHYTKGSDLPLGGFSWTHVYNWRKGKKCCQKDLYPALANTLFATPWISMISQLWLMPSLQTSWTTIMHSTWGCLCKSLGNWFKMWQSVYWQISITNCQQIFQSTGNDLYGLVPTCRMPFPTRISLYCMFSSEKHLVACTS